MELHYAAAALKPQYAPPPLELSGTDRPPVAMTKAQLQADVFSRMALYPPPPMALPGSERPPVAMTKAQLQAAVTSRMALYPSPPMALPGSEWSPVAMTTAQLDTAIAGLHAKKLRLRESFDRLVACSPFPIPFTWDDLDAHISSLQSSVSLRFRQLRALEAPRPVPVPTDMDDEKDEESCEDVEMQVVDEEETASPLQVKEEEKGREAKKVSPAPPGGAMGLVGVSTARLVEVVSQSLGTRQEFPAVMRQVPNSSNPELQQQYMRRRQESPVAVQHALNASNPAHQQHYMAKFSNATNPMLQQQHMGKGPNTNSPVLQQQYMACRQEFPVAASNTGNPVHKPEHMAKAPNTGIPGDSGGRGQGPGDSGTGGRGHKNNNGNKTIGKCNVKGNGNMAIGKRRGKGKPQVTEPNEKSEQLNQICYRCGCKGHWSRTCRTPKHWVQLYQKVKMDQKAK